MKREKERCRGEEGEEEKGRRKKGEGRGEEKMKRNKQKSKVEEGREWRKGEGEERGGRNGKEGRKGGRGGIVKHKMNVSKLLTKNRSISVFSGCTISSPLGKKVV